MGLGALAMPHALQKSGIGLGAVLFLAFVATCHYTSVLLVSMANKIGVKSYEELTQTILGKWGYIFFCFICLFLNGGAMLGYMICIKQSVDLEIELFNLKKYGTLIVVGICCVVFPLGFVKDWESLSIISKLKTFVYATLILFILVRGATDPLSSSQSFEWTKIDGWISKNWTDGLGIIAFAMVFHDSIFPAWRSMKDKSTKTWNKTSLITSFLTMSLNLIIGIGGVINFSGKKIPTMILTSDTDIRIFSNDKWFRIARMMLVSIMLMTLPIYVAVLREYIESIINVITKDKDKPKKESSNKQFFLITFISECVCIGLFCSPMANSLENILDAVGNYGAVTLAFILPPIIYAHVYSVGRLFRRIHTCWFDGRIEDGDMKIEQNSCQPPQMKDATFMDKIAVVAQVVIPFLIFCV